MRLFRDDVNSRREHGGSDRGLEQSAHIPVQPQAHIGRGSLGKAVPQCFRL